MSRLLLTSKFVATVFLVGYCIDSGSCWAGQAGAHNFLAPMGRSYLWPAHFWTPLNITYYSFT